MAPPDCCVCSKISTVHCPTCKSADYCGSGCQDDDTSFHELLCKPIMEFTTTTPRPANDCVLALHFPILPFLAKGKPPMFIWFDGKNNVTMNKPGGYTKRVNCLADEKSRNPDAKSFEIFQNCTNKINLDHTIILYHRDNFGIDGSRVNLSLLETAEGAIKMLWGGPLVVYSKRGIDTESNKVDRDITLSDFRVFLNFCKVYGTGLGSLLRDNNLFELEITNQDLFAKVLDMNSGGHECRGVEIACDGDTKILDMQRFRGLDVPANHPIWATSNSPSLPTEATKMVGIPLQVRRIYPDARFTTRAAWMLNNDQAVYLGMGVDDRSPTWGKPDSGYTGPYGQGQIHGRVLVVREDKKDITAHQVEALTAFFRDDVKPKIIQEERERLSKLSKGEASTEKRKFMAKLVRKAKFIEFFQRYKREKIEGGDISWDNEVAPCEVETGESSESGVVRLLGDLSVNDA